MTYYSDRDVCNRDSLRESEGVLFFTGVGLCVCVCLSLATITKKIVDGFVPNFTGGFLGGKGKTKFVFHYDR